MTTRFLVVGTILAVSFAFVVAEDRSWVGADAGDAPITRDMANRIERALKERADCDFTDNPLEEVLRYFENAHHIPVWLDKQALEDEGVATDQQVTLVRSDITLQTAFSMVLEPLGLTTLTENGLLRVTTQAKADERLSTRVYPVSDLVSSAQDNESYLTLMMVIQQATSGKWIDIDQEGGSISPFPNARGLVIRQTQKVQREIEGLLAALRKAKRLQDISSIPANSDDPESLNPIEPIRSKTRPTLRAPRSTQSWQRPRIDSGN